MADNIRLSLQVTVLGMSLVILTLVIVGAIIMLLDRIFRPKPPTKETSAAPSAEPESVPVMLTIAPTSVNLPDEAAAISLAIALQRGRRKSIIKNGNLSAETGLTSEVVSVVSIKPGDGVWTGAGRLKQIK
jgi:hypothetical protein